MLGPLDLVAIEIGTALLVEAEIAAEALGGDQAAGGFGMVFPQALELGLKRFQKCGSAPFLPVGFFLVQAQNVAPAALSFT
jgi:hypothetical protein